jgi:5-methylcytosine-specific restriction enzyme subunit McrC
MSIPIQNLYYLLTYAWDRRLDQGDLSEVEAAACPNLNSLFARVLCHGVRHLLRRGLDRSYVGHEELTSRVRGRIDFAASARRETWRQGKMECAYDELSHDVLPNRILKACLLTLHRDKTVDKEAAHEVARLLPVFEQVGVLALHASHFRRIQLHRNNRIYRFLLQLCEMIHRSYLPDESRDGRLRFRDILSDEKTMAAIFEKFVRNFATRHLEGAEVSGMHIDWNAETESPATRDLMPAMKTDVTIEWKGTGRKLIVDCKYYRDALKGQFDKEKFISGNLYQLHAYLTNKAIAAGWENAEGMLLYPTNGVDLDHRFVLQGRHAVRIATLDLNQGWKEIEGELQGVLGGCAEP